jgi:hypothetical protein
MAIRIVCGESDYAALEASIQEVEFWYKIEGDPSCSSLLE